MPRIKPRRTGACVYCGVVGPLTRDHVPPKTLFATSSAGKLITVPCCPECNQRASGDDEYFRLVLVMRRDTYYHPEAHSLLASIYRSLSNPNKVGFSQAFLRQLRPVSLVNAKGRVVGETGAYNIDVPRIARVIERITRGLFYRETGRPLPLDYSVLVVNENDYMGWTVEYRKHFDEVVMRQIMANDPNSFGHDVFFYRKAPVDTDPLQGVWQMVFYKTVGFVCFVMSPANTREFEKAHSGNQ
jgi:hypothetical protein